jgi:putative MATE family efflux protein
MAKTKSLTEGTPWKLILAFALPVFVGNVFQLLYSLIDTKIVGSTLGALALASVGSVSTLHSLLTGFINGLTLGFSIITAMYFGAGNEKKLRKSFAMSMLLGIVTTAVLVAVMVIFLTPILGMLHVPNEEFDMAYSYVSILIVGLLVTVFYNVFANTLRAIGDAVTPLIFLVVASVSNVALDYLFILGFGMGVKGAAYATVLAQLLSVLLCIVRIRRKFPILHVEKSDFRIQRDMVWEMCKSGLSMGLMSCLVSFGTVSLQSAINTLGTTVIVAHTAARKVFEILSLPTGVLGSAMATFSSQNYGAKKYDRIRVGLKSTLIMGVIWSGIVVLLSQTVSKYLIGFIASSSDSEILYWGTTYLKIDMSFVLVCVMIIILRNTMQGFGDRVTPVISSLIELVGKVIFAFVFVPHLGYWGIIWAEPVVWICMVIPLIIKTYRFLYKQLER